jgi:hypothetical protein
MTHSQVLAPDTNHKRTLGSFTSVHMLPTMRAALRLVSPVRSRSPRCTTGTTSAREGASMVLIKVVARRVSRQGWGCRGVKGVRGVGVQWFPVEGSK